jgi:hypothetical protein
MTAEGGGWQRRRGEGSVRRRGGRRVVSGLFFFPRGGSAQVVRALSRALAETGWEVTLAAGSLGQAGDQTHAATFFAGADLVAVDYSPGRPAARAVCRSSRRMRIGRARRIVSSLRLTTTRTSGWSASGWTRSTALARRGRSCFTAARPLPAVSRQPGHADGCPRDLLDSRVWRIVRAGRRARSRSVPAPVPVNL